VAYVELHCHSAYSFLDGASHPEELALAAAELGYKAIALTDHEGVYGSLEFARAAKDFGVRAITGAEFAAMNDAELERQIEGVGVIARVAPEDKVRLVDVLKRKGHVVAMTGDGVNDAPSLKAADIGIAMGVTGTEVTKEAAKMILADDNFATIVEAVREGRGILDNIRKFLRYLLSSNMGEVLTVFFGVVGAGVIGLNATDLGAGGKVGRPEMGEGEVLLEERRPASAGRVADLPATDVDGRARPPRCRRDLRRKSDVGVQLLERVPVEALPRPPCLDNIQIQQREDNVVDLGRVVVHQRFSVRTHIVTVRVPFTRPPEAAPYLN